MIEPQFNIHPELGIDKPMFRMEDLTMLMPNDITIVPGIMAAFHTESDMPATDVPMIPVLQFRMLATVTTDEPGTEPQWYFMCIPADSVPALVQDMIQASFESKHELEIVLRNRN